MEPQANGGGGPAPPPITFQIALMNPQIGVMPVAMPDGKYTVIRARDPQSGITVDLVMPEGARRRLMNDLTASVIAP